MRLDLVLKLVFISTLFITSLNAQTEVGEDTVQTEEPQLIESGIDPLDLEFGEMIFDETITKVGRDFYDIFYTNWSNPTPIKDFSISIMERPMPGIGTQIRVVIDEHEIVNQIIRPNQEQIEMLAEYSIGLASQYLLNYQEIQSQLQSEDQSGTGIF
jgi:curli production assembly/transport component CsgE